MAYFNTISVWLSYWALKEPSRLDCLDFGRITNDFRLAVLSLSLDADLDVSPPLNDLYEALFRVFCCSRSCLSNSIAA